MDGVVSSHPGEIGQRVTVALAEVKLRGRVEVKVAPVEVVEHLLPTVDFAPRREYDDLGVEAPF